MVGTCVLVSLGQLCCLLGIVSESMLPMLIGRVIFGLGGESLSVASSTLVSAWFGGRELALAMGINLSFSRLGSVLNDNLSPVLADMWGGDRRDGLVLAFAVGFGFCIFSLFAAIALFCVRMDEGEGSKKQLSTPKIGRRPPSSSTDQIAGRGSSFEGRPGTPGKANGSGETTASVTEFLGYMGGGFGLLSLHCMASYGAILPFNNISAALLDAQYFPHHGKTSEQSTALVQSIPYTVSAFLTPVVGSAVDKYGRRQVWMVTSAFMLAVAHFCLAYDVTGPVFPFCVIGLAYSVVAGVVWPSVLCVVKPSSSGTAFGLLTALQNISMALVPLFVAFELDIYGSKNYVLPELTFVILSVIGAVAAILLSQWDTRNRHALWKAKIDTLPSTPKSSSTRLAVDLDDQQAVSMRVLNSHPQEQGPGGFYFADPETELSSQPAGLMSGPPGPVASERTGLLSAQQGSALRPSQLAPAQGPSAFKRVRSFM